MFWISWCDNLYKIISYMILALSLTTICAAIAGSHSLGAAPNLQAILLMPFKWVHGWRHCISRGIVQNIRMHSWVNKLKKIYKCLHFEMQICRRRFRVAFSCTGSLMSHLAEEEVHIRHQHCCKGNPYCTVCSHRKLQSSLCSCHHCIWCTCYCYTDLDRIHHGMGCQYLEGTGFWMDSRHNHNHMLCSCSLRVLHFGILWYPCSNW